MPKAAPKKTARKSQAKPMSPRKAATPRASKPAQTSEQRMAKLASAAIKNIRGIHEERAKSSPEKVERGATFMLKADPQKLELLSARSACLLNVAQYLREADIASADLLSDLANEMEGPLAMKSYEGVVSVGISLLKDFAKARGVVVEREPEPEAEIDQKQAGWQGMPLTNAEFKSTDQSERAFLAKCLMLYRNQVSNATAPLEDFLVNEVENYARGKRKTPDELINAINDEDGFRPSFDDAVCTAKFTQKSFPKPSRSRSRIGGRVRARGGSIAVCVTSSNTGIPRRFVGSPCAPATGMCYRSCTRSDLAASFRVHSAEGQHQFHSGKRTGR